MKKAQVVERNNLKTINNMQTYTKEQLIEAQKKYNKNYKEDPSFFIDIQKQEFSEDEAIASIEYLLSLVE